MSSRTEQYAKLILRRWSSARSVKIVDGDDCVVATDPDRDGRTDYTLTLQEARRIVGKLVS